MDNERNRLFPLDSSSMESGGSQSRDEVDAKGTLLARADWPDLPSLLH